jgi:hypothetical protein
MKPSVNSSLSFQVGGLVLVLASLMATGCRPSAPGKDEHTSNLAHIGQAYDEATARLGRPPQDMDDLKPYLERYGRPDRILRSPHDGLPYVILWGRKIGNPTFTSQPPTLLAYEQQGVGGTRYVLTAAGVMSMTDDEFERARPR